MQFRIASSFSDSLAKLPAQEQKAAKTTAFDLQFDPANPGMQFHRLDRAKDPNFWSVRVNRDLRIIVHRTSASLMLCYVGHPSTQRRTYAGRRTRPAQRSRPLAARSCPTPRFSIPCGEFAAHSAEVFAFLAGHRDTGILEVFRGAVAHPEAGRTGGMNREVIARDTSCRVRWFSDVVRKREGRLMVRSRAAP